MGTFGSLIFVSGYGTWNSHLTNDGIKSICWVHHLKLEYLWVSSTHRKVAYKSRGLCATFQLFATVRLLFKYQASGAAFISEGGLYAKSRVCKTRKSGLVHVKWKWNLTLRLFQNYFKSNRAFGMRKAVGFSPASTTPGRFFKLRLLYECGLCASWVRRKCSFYRVECGF